MAACSSASGHFVTVSEKDRPSSRERKAMSLSLWMRPSSRRLWNDTTFNRALHQKRPAEKLKGRRAADAAGGNHLGLLVREQRGRTRARLGKSNHPTWGIERRLIEWRQENMSEQFVRFGLGPNELFVLALKSRSAWNEVSLQGFVISTPTAEDIEERCETEWNIGGDEQPRWPFPDQIAEL